MKKQKENKIIKIIIAATFFFFIGWGIYAVLTKDVEFVFDRFFSAAIVLLAFFLYKKMNLKLSMILIALFALMIHHLKLYGNFYLGIPFDRIMHFSAGFALAIIFYQYLLSLEGKKPNKWKISLLAICIVAGIASFMEIIEFVGYSLLGEGEGLLFYGTGDFGEWNNVSWDLICNTSGAIFGVLMFSLYTIKKKIKNIKYIKKIAKYIISLVLIIIITFIMSPFASTNKDIDPIAKEYDFNYILNITEVNKTDYINYLNELKEKEISNFAKADIYLILGRLTNDDKLICKSLDYYVKADKSNPEELALAYETIASLNCRNHKKQYYEKAAEIWDQLGNKFRADLDRDLANNKQPQFKYNLKELEITEKEKIDNWNQIIIGKSFITLDKEDILVSQTDRVTRDWLTAQINQSPYGGNLLNVFAERYIENIQIIMPEIGWHEGARIKEIKQSGLTHKIASGTIVIKINDKWYAPDEKGVFRFEVLKDKILYPTTRFLKKDIALIIDTHGISALVEQAVRNNATVVIGCCDSKGKIKAAQYLSKKGIKTICLTDRFLPDILFQDRNIIGSPPIKKQGNNYILGNQQITIKNTDKIIVQDIDSNSEIHGILYYDTPARYFKQLQKTIDLDVKYIKIDNFNQASKIIKMAELDNANIIAVRIYNQDDYNQITNWLKKSKQHKAVLFHSTSYPLGYKTFKEFPEQTSFDDINPIIT